MITLEAENRRVCKEVRCAVMFDDCSLRMAGSFWEVAHFLGRAARGFIAGLERDIGCKVQAGGAGSARPRDALVRVIDHGELKQSDEARNLGVGYVWCPGGGPERLARALE